MLDAFRKDGISTPEGHLGGAMIASGLHDLATVAGFIRALGKKQKGGKKTVIRG